VEPENGDRFHSPKLFYLNKYEITGVWMISKLSVIVLSMDIFKK
jgi:hypothetical protein